MENLIRRGEAQDLLKCYTQKNNLGHTPYEIVSNLPAAGPKWISVKERLPEESGRYLVRYKRCIDIDGGLFDDRIMIMRFWKNCAWQYPIICNDDVRQCVTMETVTHWMPLPEPPEENSNE